MLKEVQQLKEEFSMPSDSDLSKLSGEHLYHEIKMIFGTAKALNQPLSDDVVKSALIESFATHTRNLIDFFYLNNPKSDDLIASQFIADHQRTSWKSGLPSITLLLTDAKTRANKEIAHLTERRIAGTPPQKEWPIPLILNEITDLLRFFVTNASPLRLHSSVKTLVLSLIAVDSQPLSLPATPPSSFEPFIKAKTHQQWFTGTSATTPSPGSILPKK
jgi:hypothetical protein